MVRVSIRRGDQRLGCAEGVSAASVARSVARVVAGQSPQHGDRYVVTYVRSGRRAGVWVYDAALGRAVRETGG